MSAVITAGANSANITVARPYDADGVTPRDDIIGMKVWYSAISGFAPSDADGVQLLTPAYDGPSLSCVIQGLLAGTNYYFKYALISEVDPTFVDPSNEYSCVPLTEAAGNTSIVVYAYKRAEALPTDTPGDVEYDFSNFEISTPTLANGWSKSIPETGGSILYVTEVLIVSAGTGTISILSSDWSSPAHLSADGITYVVHIESTNGDVFKVGQSLTTYLKAHVFKNGVDVTDEISDSKFRWRRVSYFPRPPPDDDATWNANYSAGYKQIMITAGSIDERATFHCDLLI